MEQPCKICGKPIKDTPSHFKRGRYTCSHSCQNKWTKTGTKQSKESNRKRSEALKGSKCYAWKGGRTKHHTGYIMIYCPDHPNAINGKYVREHRLVMEKHLGRYLTRKEVVHHINGSITDNRIENLELFSSAGHHAKKYHFKLTNNKPGTKC